MLRLLILARPIQSWGERWAHVSGSLGTQSMHNGASNEIKEIEVCKKCPKEKPYCAPIFDPIMFKPFLDDAILPKFCVKCFSLSNSHILGVFFGFVCEKSWGAGRGTIDEIHTMIASCHEQKKPRRHKNSPGSPSLWILHLKYTDIFQIFS